MSGVVLVARLIKCWMLRCFAPLHDGYILCHGGRAIQNSSFRAKRRIQNYNSDQRSSRPANGFFESRCREAKTF
ncbi:MAG: hypothetical protein IJW31_08770 [Lentisphaeria bacterium]|nr:hypothetical protein [Lentisphaeria bacterium]